MCVDEVTDEPLEIVQRVAALDIGKAGLVACLRVPHEDKPGRRRQEVREYATMTRSLLDLADWLRCQQVQLVAMEATSSYWKPVFYLLEAEGFTCWLLNAKHVKNAPRSAVPLHLNTDDQVRTRERRINPAKFRSIVSIPPCSRTSGVPCPCSS